MPTTNALSYAPTPVRNFGNVSTGNASPLTYFEMTGDFWRRPEARTVPSRGYGLDLDGDGLFQGNRDGVLAFDMNKDGQVDEKEVGMSQVLMRALKGDQDLNQDGRVEDVERQVMDSMRGQAGNYDRDGDGKLNQYELQQAGARVLVDKNQDGKFTNDEAQAIDKVESGAGRFALNTVDLRADQTGVANLDEPRYDDPGYDDRGPRHPRDPGYDDRRPRDPGYGDRGPRDPRDWGWADEGPGGPDACDCRGGGGWNWNPRVPPWFAFFSFMFGNGWGR